MLGLLVQGVYFLHSGSDWAWWVALLIFLVFSFFAAWRWRRRASLAEKAADLEDRLRNNIG